MSEQRKKIRDRVKRLREMTPARGCTEAEALAAAEKAAQLMREHGISDRDLDVDEQASPSRQRGSGQKARLWPVIAHCTNTAVIVVTEQGRTRVSFVGREPGPEIAVYLRDICERAVDREVTRFKRGKLYRRKRSLAVKRQVIAAFTGGLVSRLSARLVDIFGPNVSADAREQAGLALEEKYPQSTNLPEPRRELRHSDATINGVLAAENVTLAHGMGAAAERLQIGRAS